MFPRARFATATDLRELHELHPRLMAFLVDPQPEHRDFYCVDLATPGPDHGVTVFAVHATVADWPSFPAWLRWVEERASRR